MSIILKLKKWIYRQISVGKNVVLGRDVHIGPFSVISASVKLEIGDNTYVGKFCTVQVNGKIGRGVLIANSVGIVGRRDHQYRPAGTIIREASWVGSDKNRAESSANSINIGDDVWIGYGSTILSGIKIGNGAVISAGSVVRKDVAPYAIMSGNPAVQVARRFEAQEIELHEIMLKNRFGEAKSNYE